MPSMLTLAIFQTFFLVLLLLHGNICKLINSLKAAANFFEVIDIRMSSVVVLIAVLFNLHCCRALESIETNKIKYARMDQVKFVEYSL